MKVKLYVKGLLMAFVGVCLAFGSAWSQGRNVRGKVVGSEDGIEIPGASVVVKGTINGTITDVEGNYSITVPSGESVLVVSFVGYETQEIVVGSQSTINVSLASDSQSLDEVVVTGYTVDSRRESTGAVSIVKAKDLTVIPSSSIEQQLQGRVSGVSVVTTSQPGSASQVRIRGYGAFGGNQPLIIVDGLPVGDANILNPGDVESVTVLKDASAASIYGARAANGVIVYTTKRGEKGAKKLEVTYDGLGGFTTPGHGFEMMNPQDQATWTWNALRNSGANLTNEQYGSGQTPVIPDYLAVGKNYGVVGSIDLEAERAKYNITGPTTDDFYQVIKANKQGTDWFDELTRTGYVHRHTLGFNGGGQNSRFYIGLSAQNQQGNLPSQKANRYAFRSNSEFDLTKKLRIGENIQITYLQILGRNGDNGGLGSSQSENDINMSYRVPTIIPVKDVFGGWAGTTAKGLGQAANPVATQEFNKLNKNFNGLAMGNIYAELDVIDGLTLRSSIGGNYVNSYGWGYGYPIYWTLENKGTIWRYNENSSFNFGWTFTNTASYKKKFGVHGLELLVGQEALNTGAGKNVAASGENPFSGDQDYITISTLNKINPATSGKNNGVNFLSYFSRAIYNFKDKYIITGVLRRDGSSRFGADSRYGLFPAVSAAWRISDEPFLKDLVWITDLKIRGGYGTMGNSNNVNPSNQFTLYAQNVSNSGYDITGSNSGIVGGYVQSRIGNPGAKWETSVTQNIGFDGTFLKGKLDVVFDLWKKDTKDLLYQLPITQTAGGATPPSVNVGTMVNKGIDLQVTTRGKFIGESNYNLTVTGGLLDNKITYIGGGLTYLSDVNPGFRGVTPIRNQLDHSLSSFYGLKVDGIFQTEEEVNSAPEQEGKQVGRLRYQDLNNDGKVNADDRTFLGSPVANFTGGINFGVTYKNFDISTYLYASLGNEIANLSKLYTDFYGLFAGAAIADKVKDSWTPENRDATIPIFEQYSGFSSISQMSDYYIEDGSYLRLQNLSIGYNLPTTVLDNLKLNRVRLGLSTNNLFTITKYSGLDPQVAGNADTNFGVDIGNFPLTRQYTFSLSVGF